MAIVKMKRLRLYAMRSQKEELLLALQKLGAVELREPTDTMNTPGAEALLHRERDSAPELRTDYTALLQSLRLLDRYAPVKTPLLAPKPEIGQEELLDDSELAHGLEVARGIIEADGRIRDIVSEETRRRSGIEMLTPWRTLSVPVELEGTERTKLVLGLLPAKTDWNALTARLMEAAPEAELFKVGSDPRQLYAAALFLREEEGEALRVLRDAGFTAVSFGGTRGTAEANIRESEAEIERILKEKENLIEWIRSKGEERECLRHSCDLVAAAVARADASLEMMGTESVLILEGYTPAEAAEKLSETLEPFDCAYELSEPDMENIPDIPTALKNNAISRPLNMVTDMYSLPAYDGLDPNPLMMPFFVLFYGIMMADMGYGLLMMIAGLVILKKKRPHGTMQHFSELLFECGITTFIMGALTGGFFGDAPLQIAKMLNPETTFTGLPALFSPLNDTIMVLIGSMILGAVQIITGMVINFVYTTKNGRFWDALMDQGSWWLFFAGIGLGAAGVTWWGAVAGLIALICTQGRHKPTFGGKLIGGIASLYDVTSYLGDILSYSRLMALMLAGSVIAQVFNTLGALPGNIFVFIPIFLVGHAINFGLNLLGCYVHDLRLQCLEYFNKFYKDGGRPFKPLKFDPKYVDVVN